MLTHSHQEPRIGAAEIALPELFVLADAFSDFISASSSLEASYEKLKVEVGQLNEELAERNDALKVSVAENERIHRALQQIVSSLPCGVLVAESTGMVAMLNAEGRNLLGLGNAEVLTLGDIFELTGLDLETFLERHTEVDAEQEFCRQVAGAKQWLSVQKRSLSSGQMEEERDHCGKQVIVTLRDITSHKVAERERERARRAIALSEVATTLAHEIRNPLTSLELFAGLVGKGGAEMPLYVSHLHAGIRLLAGTVNNVLAVHGNSFPSMKRLDLVASLRSSVEFVRPIADEAGVLLNFSGPTDAVEIEGNGSALQQMVLNLLCNAVRYTAREGAISVEVQVVDREKTFARILFSDTGTGIEPQHLDKLFQLGFSVSGASSGLGLAVCKDVVEQHRGTIHVASVFGTGTTFVVEIPTL